MTDFGTYMERAWGSETLWPGWEALEPLSAREQLRRLALVFGRNQWPALLFDFETNDQLTDDELRSALLEAWNAPEAPQAALGVPDWVALFRRAGFVTDQSRSAPTEPIAIYRGSTWAR